MVGGGRAHLLSRFYPFLQSLQELNEALLFGFLCAALPRPSPIPAPASLSLSELVSSRLSGETPEDWRSGTRTGSARHGSVQLGVGPP